MGEQKGLVQSLTKLNILIISTFQLHCRGEWQFALTKQIFSDTFIIWGTNKVGLLDSYNQF